MQISLIVLAQLDVKDIQILSEKLQIPLEKMVRSAWDECRSSEQIMRGIRAQIHADEKSGRKTDEYLIIGMEMLEEKFKTAEIVLRKLTPLCPAMKQRPTKAGLQRLLSRG